MSIFYVCILRSRIKAASKGTNSRDFCPFAHSLPFAFMLCFLRLKIIFILSSSFWRTTLSTFFYFSDRIFLCSTACPGTHYVEEVSAFGNSPKVSSETVSDSRMLRLKTCIPDFLYLLLVLSRTEAYRNI